MLSQVPKWWCQAWIVWLKTRNGVRKYLLWHPNSFYSLLTVSKYNEVSQMLITMAIAPYTHLDYS